MVIAIATVTIPDPSIPLKDRDTSARETLEVSGEGGDWGAAMDACAIPDGGLVLHWIRG